MSKLSVTHPDPSPSARLRQLLIIFSLNCRGQTTFSDGVVTLVLLLGKYFTLGRTHNRLTCVPAFGERENERDILVLSFVL